MSALAEFLRTKAAEEAATQESRHETIAEWQVAIERFLDVIRGWITASDPEGRLQVRVDEHEIREEGFGRYPVKNLVIEAFGKTIQVTPWARNTITTHDFDGKRVRAVGRLNLHDGLNQIAMYRFPGPNDDRWMIDAPNRGFLSCDRAQFEKALVSFLK